MAGLFALKEFNYNNITQNIATYNEDIGIRILNGSHNTISYNNIGHNCNGLIIRTYSYNNTITNLEYNGVGTCGAAPSLNLYDYAQNNIVENNVIKSNSDSGITIYQVSNSNLIRNNTLTNNTEGINIGGTFTSSSYNKIFNNIINKCNDGVIFGYGWYNVVKNNTINNSKNYGISISNFAFENLVWNSWIINSTTKDVYILGTTNPNITFLNVSFNNSHVQLQHGKLSIKWYLDAYVNYSDGNPVSGAYVTAYIDDYCEGVADACSDFKFFPYGCEEHYGCTWNDPLCQGTAIPCSNIANSSGCNQQHGCSWTSPDIINVTTNSSGYIQRQNITEYYDTSYGKVYLTNYSINASINPHSETESVNLTTNKIIDDNTEIVLTITEEPTTLTAIYQPSLYTNTYFNIRANYSTTSGTPISGATCNLTIIPSLDGVAASSFYVMGYNSGTGLYETLGLATSFADTYSIVIECGKQYYQFQSGAGSFTVNEQSGGGGGGGSSPGQEPVCGNKICEEGETCINCPNDCVCVCGNDICEPGETYKTCNEDCCAPEGIQVSPPYNCCPGLISVSDCLFGPCPFSIRYCIRCGDGICKEYETIKNCPEDCGVCNFNIPIKIRFVKGTSGGVVPQQPTQPEEPSQPGLR